VNVRLARRIPYTGWSVATLGLTICIAGCSTRAVAMNPASERARTLMTASFGSRFDQATRLLAGSYYVPLRQDCELFRYEARVTHTPWDRIRWTIHCPPTRVVSNHSWTTGSLATCTITFNQRWIGALQLQYYTPLRSDPTGTFSAYDWDVGM
jgi:hypothetical protein